MIDDPSVQRDTSEQDRCVESHKKSSVIIERKRLWERLTMLEASIYFLDTYVNIVKLYVQPHRCASTIWYLALG